MVLQFDLNRFIGIKTNSMSGDHFIVDLDNTLCDTSRWEIEDPTGFDRADYSRLNLFQNSEDILSKLPGRRVLLSSTRSIERQREKIEFLKLVKYFDKIILVDSSDRDAKLNAIREYLIKNTVLEPKKVFIVGDGVTNEIRAGQILGCSTVHVNIFTTSERSLETLERDVSTSDITIDSLSELPAAILKIKESYKLFPNNE